MVERSGERPDFRQEALKIIAKKTKERLDGNDHNGDLTQGIELILNIKNNFIRK